MCFTYSLTLLHESLKVIWKSAFKLLDLAFHFLSICPEACCFIERHAESVFGWVSEPSTIGSLDNETVILIVQFLMHYFQQRSYNALQKIPPELLQLTLKSLQQVMDQFLLTNRAAVLEFYAAWRSLSLKLISSPSLPLQMAGWGQVNKMIQACADRRPPPRQYIVSDAGSLVVNGIYHFTGPLNAVGGASLNLTYTRRVPKDAPGVGGRTLTLFCRNTEYTDSDDDSDDDDDEEDDEEEDVKWWFISETHAKNRSTRRDRHYYQHKDSNAHLFPPCNDWVQSDSGILPPPRLQPQGVAVPPGQERATLEHQLVAWAMENSIVERVLADATLHPDVLAQSVVLLQFLVDVSHRDADWSVAGLIPALCEGSQQRRAMNTEYCSGMTSHSHGVLRHPNEWKASKVKKQKLADQAGECSPFESVATEPLMGGLLHAKRKVQERKLQALGSSIEKLSNRKMTLLREYRKADDDFLKNEIKSWILSINEELARAQNDLKELLGECEKYGAGMEGASYILGDSGDRTFTKTELNSGDDKDCSIDTDSNKSSDGSRSMDEGQV
jgi:hypothetical protein